MIKQSKNETRLEYLSRVLSHLMHNSIAGEETVNYDKATCDGMCLASDFEIEVSEVSFKLLNIKAAINKYYAALDSRQHGGVAMDEAFREIEAILGMSWGK
jgi:hypothetical protein